MVRTWAHNRLMLCSSCTWGVLLSFIEIFAPQSFKIRRWKCIIHKLLSMTMEYGLDYITSPWAKKKNCWIIVTLNEADLPVTEMSGFASCYGWWVYVFAFTKTSMLRTSFVCAIHTYPSDTVTRHTYSLLNALLLSHMVVVCLSQVVCGARSLVPAHGSWAGWVISIYPPPEDQTCDQWSNTNDMRNMNIPCFLPLRGL